MAGTGINITVVVIEDTVLWVSIHDGKTVFGVFFLFVMREGNNRVLFWVSTVFPMGSETASDVVPCTLGSNSSTS